MEVACIQNTQKGWETGQASPCFLNQVWTMPSTLWWGNAGADATHSLFFFTNAREIYCPQQEAAKMDTELRSTWSRAWNKAQMGPHIGLVQLQFWTVSMEFRACFANVSAVVFWFLLILKSWVWRVAAMLEKTWVNGLILHLLGFWKKIAWWNL